jgi:hypothetical protein
MRLCSIDGCESKHFSLNYCRSHWRRLKVYGDPLGVPEPRPWQHGTVTGYKNHHCRCDVCRAAGVGYDVEIKKGACARCGAPTSSKYTVTHCRACRFDLVEAAHGTEARYKRCRCDECRAASSAARRRRRARVAA